MIHRVFNICRQAFSTSSNTSRKRKHDDDDGMSTPGLPSYSYKMSRLATDDDPSGSSTPTTRGEWKEPHKRPLKQFFSSFTKSEKKKENVAEPDVIVLEERVHQKSQSGIGMAAGPSRMRFKQQENMSLEMVEVRKTKKEKEVQIIEKDKKSRAVASTSKDPALCDIESSWLKPKVVPSQRFQLLRPNLSKNMKAKSVSKSVFGEGVRKRHFQGRSALQTCYKFEEKTIYQNMLSQYLHCCAFKPSKKRLSITLGNPQFDETSIELVDLTLTEDKLDIGKTISVTKFDSPLKRTPQISVPVTSSKQDDEVQLLLEVQQKNSLEKILKNKAAFSDEWLPNIVSKFREDQQMRDEEVRKTRSRLELLDEKSKTEFHDKYVTKLEKQIQLFDISKEEEELEGEGEEIFPQLSDEAEDMVERALIPNPKQEVLVSSATQSITRHDISTLSGLSWLNDEIINFYLELVVERGRQDNYPSVHAFNTFFYPKVMNQGYNPVKRWTKKVDIFSFDLLLVPVHLGMHWCMVIIDIANKKITYYDSLGGSDRGGLKKMLQYLSDESMDKKNKPFDTSGWQLVVAQDIPHQMNGSDCGMFSCMFAETVSRRKPIKFTQDHMPYFRRRMTYEIITKTLME